MNSKMNDKESHNEQKDISPEVTLRHYLLFPIIICFVMAAVVMVLIEPQYAYFALQRERNITSIVSDARQSLCETNTSSTRFKVQQEIQSETAKWHAYCHLASSIPALVMTMFVGSWSDKIGRKVAFLIPVAGLLFKSGFIAIGMALEWNIYILIVPFVVEGMCGTFISLVALAYSFAADLTTNGKSRTYGIVFVEIIGGIGVISGNLISGYLVKHIGFLYGTLLVFGLGAVSVFFIFSLPESIRKKQNLKSISQRQYIKNAVEFYTKKGPLRWKYIVLAIVFAFSQLPNIGRINVQSLYVMNSPFCWNSVLIGWFGSTRALLQMVVGLAIARIILKYFSERTLCIAGTVSAISYYVLTAFAVNDVMLFLAPVVGILGNNPMTMVRAILSGLTPTEKQGAMFGGLAAVDAVCSLIGSVFANFIYSETVLFYKGLIMLVFAGYHLISLGILGGLVYGESKEKKKLTDEMINGVKLIYVVKL